MTSKRRVTMQVILRYGFTLTYMQADAKLIASWSGVSAGYCRTALRQLVAMGFVEAVIGQQGHRAYRLTETGWEARAAWWVPKGDSK